LEPPAFFAGQQIVERAPLKMEVFFARWLTLFAGEDVEHISIHFGKITGRRISPQTPLSFDGKLSGGGDKQTYKCLSAFRSPRNNVDCLDIVMRLNYTLTDHPNTLEDQRLSGSR
jgi:hypothetical protein